MVKAARTAICHLCKKEVALRNPFEGGHVPYLTEREAKSLGLRPVEFLREWDIPEKYIESVRKCAPLAGVALVSPGEDSDMGEWWLYTSYHYFLKRDVVYEIERDGYILQLYGSWHLLSGQYEYVCVIQTYEGEEVDVVYPFFGDDFKKNGLFDAVDNAITRDRHARIKEAFSFIFDVVENAVTA